MTDQLKTFFVVLGIILSFTGLLVYLADVLRGRTKPHVYTWFIWSLLTAVGFLGQLADGGGKGAWVSGVSSLGSFIVFLLALKQGEKKRTFSDHVSLAVALVAILLWPLTKTPLYSLILVTLIDTLGYYPTFRKSWDKPLEENLTAYILAIFMHMCGLAALENHSLITMLYPVVIIFNNTAFSIYLIWRRLAMPRFPASLGA